MKSSYLTAYRTDLLKSCKVHKIPIKGVASFHQCSSGYETFKKIHTQGENQGKHKVAFSLFRCI